MAPSSQQVSDTESQASGPGAKHVATPTTASKTPPSQPAGVPSRLYGKRPQLQDLIDLRTAAAAMATLDRYRLASIIDGDVVVYDAAVLLTGDIFEQPDKLSQLQDELYDILLQGPGVFVLKGMYPPSDGEHSVIDAANEAFQHIIEVEAAAANGNKGDHFAANGKNARIWNSFSKHALIDPKSFVEYYSNRWLPVISEAWLGPAYRVTTQVNIVRPGGLPQVSHRDHHLGFQTAEACAQYPTAMQVASQLLTLQGAVAHSDMSLASGPTRFLPFSQRFQEGYMAYRLPEFIEYFDKNWISLPLQKGDGVFFNPALFHAAGKNSTQDIHRSANLIQVSSAFGKTMESVDSVAIVEKCWSYLSNFYEQNGLKAEVQAIIKAVGEGYPFPTNLDRRPPAPGGMAPEDEQTLLKRCLKKQRSLDFVVHQLRRLKLDSQA